MNGNNSQTKEGFIKSIGHPRKQDLANMIFDGAEVSAMREAGFGRINILEMARNIKHSVEGMEGLDIDIPRTEGDDEPVSEEAPAEATTEAEVTAPTAPDATVTAPVEPTAEEKAAIDSMVDYTITEETVASFGPKADGSAFQFGEVVKLPADHAFVNPTAPTAPTA